MNTNNGKKILVIVDAQNDFVSGTLGSGMAESAMDNIVKKISKHGNEYDMIIFTRDIHFENYMETLEGKKLPVLHCQKGSKGSMIVERVWNAVSELKKNGKRVRTFDKHTFGSRELVDYLATVCTRKDTIEFCGVCTDICVVSNVICLRAALPNNTIVVDAKCCAGVTEENHNAALVTMASCQIEIV